MRSGTAQAFSAAVLVLLACLGAALAQPTQLPPGKVEVVEILGSDQYVFGTVGGDSITARVDPNLKVEPGDRVRLSLDTRRLHAFDPAGEQALL